MVLSQVDIAADVMTSSRSLINWLDRNSTNLVLDYNEFRQTILRDALELSTIPVRHVQCIHSYMYTFPPSLMHAIVYSFILSFSHFVL